MKRRLALTGMLVATIILQMMLPPWMAGAEADTPWLDENWRYRREVSISNPCGAVEGDYPVLVTLDSEFPFGQAQSDGSDVRVTAADGTTELPFWIDAWDSTGQTAGIWVNVPSIPVEGTTIYLYYGNTAASSASDGASTFLVYDGFEGNNVGNLPVAPTAGHWTKYAGNPILDCLGCGFGSTIYDSDTGLYHHYDSWGTIDHYTSADGISWTADPTNPVLVASQTWEGSNVGVPMAWKEGSTWYMLYRGGSPTWIGLATSTDGVSWTKSAENPVVSGDTGAWDDRDLDPWGVIKIGSTYYLWYNTIGAIPGLGRGTGLATSTNLTDWAKDANNPIFTGGRFCAFPFIYGGYYYLLIPHYTSGSDYSQIELYRDTSPTFYPDDREYLGVAINYGPTDWDDHDQDTPAVLTDDIYRDSFTAAGNQLWVYYAGEGGDGSWRTGLTMESDIAAAIAGVSASSLSWSSVGDVTVVDSPVRHGVRAVRQHDTNAGGSVTLTGIFSPLIEGSVGAWMRRTSTSVGDYDIYVYGGSYLAAVVGLGGNGDFHYWSGSFQPTGISWAADTWYLVALDFDAATDTYDFVAYDEGMTEIARVEGISFGNATSSVDRAMLYTSSAYVGDGFADDFRVRDWCGGDAAASVSAYEESQEMETIAGTGPVSFELLGIALEVQAQGTLSSVQIVHTTRDHVQATTAMEPGYWYIRPNTGAAGYSVDLSLPHDNLTDPKVCEYTAGPGYGWECAADSATTTLVTRNGVASFSDWTVGSNIGPTAVGARVSAALSRVGVAPLAIAVLVIGLGTTALGLVRRRRG